MPYRVTSLRPESVVIMNLEGIPTTQYLDKPLMLTDELFLLNKTYIQAYLPIVAIEYKSDIAEFEEEKAPVILPPVPGKVDPPVVPGTEPPPDPGLTSAPEVTTPPITEEDTNDTQIEDKVNTLDEKPLEVPPVPEVKKGKAK